MLALMIAVTTVLYTAFWSLLTLLYAGGVSQPYYKVLVDTRDRPLQTTYVAQQNIDIQGTLPGGGTIEDDLEIHHPEVCVQFHS